MLDAESLRAGLTRAHAEIRALVPLTPATQLAHSYLNDALRKLFFAAQRDTLPPAPPAPPPEAL